MYLKELYDSLKTFNNYSVLDVKVKIWRIRFAFINAISSPVYEIRTHTAIALTEQYQN